MFEVFENKLLTRYSWKHILSETAQIKCRIIIHQLNKLNDLQRNFGKNYQKGRSVDVSAIVLCDSIWLWHPKLFSFYHKILTQIKQFLVNYFTCNVLCSIWIDAKLDCQAFFFASNGFRQLSRWFFKEKRKRTFFFLFF